MCYLEGVQAVRHHRSGQSGNDPELEILRRSHNHIGTIPDRAESALGAEHASVSMGSPFTKGGYRDSESGDRYLVGEDDLGCGSG